MDKKIESEKPLERCLDKSVRNLGGWTLKLLPTFVRGLPDRLVLHQGRAFFCEIKTTKKRPEPAQVVVHRKLKKYGFEVYIIDSTEAINNFIKLLV